MTERNERNEGAGLRGPAPRPCASCPYRRDVPSGVWAAEEYAKLPGYDGTTLEQLEAGAVGVFACHQQDGRVCAGWAGCHDGANLLGLRFAGSLGLMSPQDVQATIDYVSPVPLFSSGAEAAEHGMAQIALPGVEAQRVIEKMTRRRQGAGRCNRCGRTPSRAYAGAWCCAACTRGGGHTLWCDRRNNERGETQP